MITIVLQTYARTEYALRTIRAAYQHLKSRDDFQWYVADDGSSKEHVSRILDEISDTSWPLLGHHSKRAGYGKNSNKAWSVCARARADVTLWLEDDWELRESLDIAPFVEVLRTVDSIGMVRLGYLTPGLKGEIISQNGVLFWKLLKASSAQVFTGHPSLRHARYYREYGPYPEGHSPGDTELLYGYAFRDTPSSVDIVWPVNYPADGLFGHIGEVRTELL